MALVSQKELSKQLLSKKSEKEQANQLVQQSLIIIPAAIRQFRQNVAMASRDNIQPVSVEIDLTRIRTDPEFTPKGMYYVLRPVFREKGYRTKLMGNQMCVFLSSSSPGKECLLM